MTGAVRDFVYDFVQKHGSPKNILEVGSLDINGNVRNLFHSAWTGIDLKEGHNVEKVMDAMDIKENFEKESFDCVMCLETLEHTKYPLTIIENMKYVLQPKGWLIITTPSINHPIHDYPGDYYRFTDQLFRQVFFDGFEEVNIVSQCYFGQENNRPDAVLGYGRKP